MLEGINAANVSAWLKDHVPELVGEVRYSLIAGGHSNLTYQCEDEAGNCYVLRRPPLGHVLQSAHDMGREHRIIDALSDSNVPVPLNYGLCTAAEVNGADFYVMEYVDGLVLGDYATATQVPEDKRRQVGLRVMDILCDLHTTDMDAVGLGDLGRKEAYLARQLKRWTKQWEATKTDPIPEMEESYRILTETMPEQVGASIVHGDFRLGNMIVKDGSMQAILDWELCTLGDPLADVGYLFNNWLTPEEAVNEPDRDIFPTCVGGYPGRDELSAIYSERTGRDLTHINYYRAFSHWRLAAIGQGVFKRYREGAMGSDKQLDLEGKFESVMHRAEQALALLQR
ncbi:MAG TPA: phosphotransferase family protein [Gammaproteobacteria bacterium]|nr:phosphotransferase family protein [Gammaproteobacteria bacterium]